MPPLHGVDLSEETTEAMSLDELWTIGVELLQWPRETPANATKTAVHQRLLEIKYRNVGDFDALGYFDELGYGRD